MRRLAPIILPFALTACGQERQQAVAQSAAEAPQASAERMEVSRSETRQPSRGPANWFTGNATITPLSDPKGQSQVGGGAGAF